MHLAREYLDLEERFPNHKGGQGSGLKCTKTHLQHFLYSDLQPFEPARTAMHKAHSLDDMRAVCSLIEESNGDGYDVKSEGLGWYHRHRCEKEGETKLDVKQHELEDDFGGCMEGMWAGEVCTADGDY